MSRKKILMTGGGAPGAAGIIRMIRAAGDYHITAADVREEVVGKYRSDDFFTLPPASDPGFADTVLHECRKRGIGLVLPLVTRELEPLHRHRASFEREAITLIVMGESLHLANNKVSLYRFFEGQPFIPEFHTATSAPQLEQACGLLGYPERAVCFKPAVSNGSRGFRILDPRKDRFAALFNEKPNAAYTTLEELRPVLQDQVLPELLVTRFFEGPEYSVDAVAINGEPVVVLPRRRMKMIGGISVEGVFEQEPTLIPYCEQIIRRLRLHGNIGLQFRADAAGHFYLLEINPRVQGTLVAALGAGVNPVGMLLQWHEEGRIDFDPAGVKWGTRFIRYWEEVYF